MWLHFLASWHQKGWSKEVTIVIVEADGETCPQIAGQLPGAAVGSCKGAPAYTCVGPPTPSLTFLDNPVPMIIFISKALWACA